MAGTVELSVGTVDVHEPSLDGWYRILSALPDERYGDVLDLVSDLVAGDVEAMSMAEVIDTVGDNLLPVVLQSPRLLKAITAECTVNTADCTGIQADEADMLTGSDAFKTIRAIQESDALDDLLESVKNVVMPLLATLAARGAAEQEDDSTSEQQSET